MTVAFRLAPISGLVIGLFAMTAGFAAADGWFFSPTYSLDPNSQCYGAHAIGDQVAVVLEASTHPFRLPDEHESTSEIRGYLVVARLTDAQGIAATRRVIGPLYTLKDTVSSAALSTGAAFGAQDRKALAAKPFLAFNSSGQLVKSLLKDNEKTWHDWTLQDEGKSAAWHDSGTRAVLPLLGWHSEQYFENHSRRYAVQKVKDGVEIYDLVADKRIRDAWVEKIAGEYFSREDLGNATLDLTDDLNYLVAFLSAGCQVERNGKTVVIEQFAMGDKTYVRENHFLVYHRPEVAPRVYEGEFGIPIVFDNKLMLLRGSDSGKEARLEDLNGAAIHSVHSAAGNGAIGIYSHLDQERLVFVDGPKSDPHKTVTVDIWDPKKKNDLKHYSFSVADLFELTSKGYFPKNVVSIKEAKP